MGCLWSLFMNIRQNGAISLPLLGIMGITLSSLGLLTSGTQQLNQFLHRQLTTIQNEIEVDHVLFTIIPILRCSLDITPLSENHWSIRTPVSTYHIMLVNERLGLIIDQSPIIYLTHKFPIHNLSFDIGSPIIKFTISGTLSTTITIRQLNL